MNAGEAVATVTCAAASITAWQIAYPGRFRIIEKITSAPVHPYRTLGAKRFQLVDVSLPAYKPVALLLTANLAADVIGAVLFEVVLAGKTGPYIGLDRAVFHAEQACFMVWPIGLAACALTVLARLPAAACFAVGAALMLCRAIAYPWLRGDRLAVLLLCEQIAVVIVGLWSLWRLHRQGSVLQRLERLPRPRLMPQERAVLALFVAEVANLLGPHIGNPFQFWWLADIGYALTFSWLVAQHRRWRWMSCYE